MLPFGDLVPGTIFASDFRIIRILATGGMGAVYVAEQISTGRNRALKLMHPGLVGSPELRDKFTLEAKVGARIASEHVVEVVAAGVDASSGAPWLAMELLEGEDLAALVRRRGSLAVEEVVTVIGQACHALAAAHRSGIVHRDLKPENIFLAEARRAKESYTVKVLDFGIAKLIEQARGSNTGAIGSPLWMAPEQTERNADITPATDVWALGLLAFFMLTGRSYWLSADQAEMGMAAFLRELVLDDLALASERAAALGVAPVPSGFDAWFARCSARDPRTRFADAAAAHTALVVQFGKPGEVDVLRKSTPQPERSSSELELGAARTLPTDPHDERPASSSEDDGPLSSLPTHGPPPRVVAVAFAVGLVTLLFGGAVLLTRGTGVKVAADAGTTTPLLPYCPKGMARLPSGGYLMGNDSGPSEERPARGVNVDAFCIDLTEVTVEEYAECVERNGCRQSVPRADWPGITADEQKTWSAFCNGLKLERYEHPINCLSFEDAAGYCAWAGKRLPSEEQWEYAARGEDGRAYPWGHDAPSPLRMNGCDDACPRGAHRDRLAVRLTGNDLWESTSPAGAYPQGVSPFGVFDMAGNVAEWVDASYCPYGQPSCASTAVVIRGGSWLSEAPAAMRATARAKASRQARAPDIGFRCVK